MSELRVRRLTIVGTGLMGASVGLAAKRAGVELVTGYDVDDDALARALGRGAIDTADTHLESAVRGADLVVVSAPVSEIPELVARSLVATGQTCTITDVGSTKRGVCAALEGEARFVGGHPLCGSETQGPADARPELFEGATWFLTRLEATEPERFRSVERFVVSLRAVPLEIDPEGHDRLVALTSHLPHALANLLLGYVGSARVDGRDPLETVGGSLRDLARIAGANPRMWSDVFLENADALAAALAELRGRMEELEAALASHDSAFLSSSIEAAAEHRLRLSDASARARP